MSSLSSLCTHNEWLFGADFGTVASLGHVSSKMSNELYRAMLKEFLFPKIEKDDMDDIWFQQDVATWYTPNAAIDVLRTVFENRIIIRYPDVNWPPRSCDLTPLDYFLWGAVTDKCSANYPETIGALKHEAKVAIHGIEAQTVENVLKN